MRKKWEATCNLQPATCNLQPATCNLQPRRPGYWNRSEYKSASLIMMRRRTGVPARLARGLSELAFEWLRT